MSVDATELERSALERKDRDELATIAQAMGGKPASRARKADIIDQILELAGVTGGNGEQGDAGGRGADEAGGDAEPGRQDAAEATSGPDEGDQSSGSPRKAQKGDGGRDEAQEGDDEGQKGEGQKGEGQKGQGKKGQADQDKAEKGDGGQGKAQKGQGGQDKAQKGQGGQDKGQKGDGGQDQADGDQGGQAEAGNRRRRRRGRDRSGGQDEPFQGDPVPVEGHLDLRDEGYGFLRVNGYLPSKEDVYVSVKQVRQFGLRKGDLLAGASRPASRNEKNPALLRVDQVNGGEPEAARSRPRFEDLTPLFPDERLTLEDPDNPNNMTARIIDLVAPIGKGQRGLIVSPPKAGKTTVMKTVARAIEKNAPDVTVVVLLVDERPEEVTDMRRSVQGEVVASTFDRPPEEHTHVAELAVERAKRMVESGQDVVLILDGITRLARAYNMAGPGTGRIMSGGIDTAAIYPPKKIFGAARNIEEGGSLTILATALVETGSKMDEVIFEEFKGTGNMELKLDRRMADRRIYPAIDVEASSTRHEELLLERKELQQVWKLRRVLSGLGGDGAAAGAAGLELLIDRMKTFKTNDEFLAEIAKAGSSLG